MQSYITDLALGRKAVENYKFQSPLNLLQQNLILSEPSFESFQFPQHPMIMQYCNALIQISRVIKFDVRN